MAKIISFGWTWPAIVAKAKSATRRNWNDDYARKFKVGEICQAWDFSPRSGHGKWIADIEITKTIFFQSTAWLCSDDYKEEGFYFLDRHKHLIPKVNNSPLIEYMGFRCPCEMFMVDWKNSDTCLAVVKFEILRVDQETLRSLNLDGEFNV